MKRGAFITISFIGLFSLLSTLLGSFLPAAANQSKEELLLAAVMNDDSDAVRELLAKGADPNAANGRGETALFTAALRGSQPVVSALIEKGARVNLPNAKDGFTPLIAAAFAGNTDIGEILIANKAAVNARDQRGGNRC